MSENIKTEIKDNIQLICLNRPAKRNAINDETVRALDQNFSSIPDHVKCVVLYGAGKHFCAGLDLSELKERNAYEGLLHSRMWHAAMDKIQFSPVPVVAAIHGACVGGGLEIASAAHIRVAEKSAFFALPEGSRGIFVGGGASVRLPKLVGMAVMTDMMLTGRIHTGAESEHLGFAQYTVEDGDSLNKAMELAKKISQNLPMTNLSLTHILPRIVDSGQDIGLMMESLTAAIAGSTAEAKERIIAFLEGRAKKTGEQ